MAVELPSALVAIIQQGVLDREFQDALFPAQLFRGLLTMREKWEANYGETTTFTRQGLLPVKTQARKPGVDPSPLSSPSIEQWTVTAAPYNDTLDTFMPTSAVSIASTFLKDAKNLGLQAGQTLNHIVRNRLYTAYTGGNTWATTTGASSTSLHVQSVNGFGNVLNASGQLVAVSAGVPLAVTLGSGLTANTVIGVAADDPVNNPQGPGTLTLGTAYAATAGDAVLAKNRAQLVRIGGALTSNGIASANTLTLASIRKAVAQLRTRNVPTFDDGTYHMHLDPTSESQIFSDPEFQLLYRGAEAVGSDVAYRDFVIAKLMGVTFFRNNEVPSATNTSSTDVIPADMTVQLGGNLGVPIHRPIIMGAGVIMEKFIDEGLFLTEAGALGKIGSFSMVNGGLGQLCDGIRYLIRAPQDRLQQVVSQTWSWSGDWGIPTDSVTGTPDMFKRAVVVEHGE